MKKLIILLAILSLNENKNKIYCDIKGSVKNPGVYEIKKDYKIQDIINDAGGLTNNSYTKNINLSKKVKDEMVIYIHSTNEIKKQEELNKCKCESIYEYIECENEEKEIIEHTTTEPIKKEEQITSITTKQISTTKKITTTTKKTITTKKEESTTTNIQETTEISKKLININTASLEELITLNGLGEKKAIAIIEYRKEKIFKTVEEIMNVNGIGESTFEKIKEYIEV